MFDVSQERLQRLNPLMTVYKPKAASLLPNLLLVAIVLAGSCLSAFGQTKLAVDSPFAPAAGGPGGAAGSPPAAYELAGASSVGSSSMICIYDTQAKHSEWIAVGDTSGPIHVVSLDSLNDRAVVVIAGERKQLSLRKATVTAAAAPGRAAIARGVTEGARIQAAPAPAPAAAPTPAPIASSDDAPAQTAPPEMNKTARDQQEARMLVSDLLEIGAQQRKAYQDAKQKATQTPAQPSN